MSHGVDLRDDLARFQIIVKAPYLPTKDKRIEKLMKRKFPGLRKSFNGGYKELNNLDFFEIADSILAKVPGLEE